MKRTKIGLIGCGNISSVYLKNLTQIFKSIDVTACADLDITRAKATAEEFSIPKYYTTEELLADPEIEIVVNLTIPKAHADICIAALEAGKHVYVEKPLAVTIKDGQKILKKAEEKGLMVGCSPDTFLGAGLQTCIKLIEDGWIGKPIAATAFMTCHGPEDWHPNPNFFYQIGGGPLLDMGPYYLTALVSMLGPVKSVAGSVGISFENRMIGNPEGRYGEKIKVEIPTHATGILNFQCGAIGTLVTSFDIWESQLPRIEIYGSEGTLSVPDPNIFDGPVQIYRQEEKQWREIPLLHNYTDNKRGIGLADMAQALVSGRKHRASGQLAYHVLEIMDAIGQSSKEFKYMDIESDCEKPTPLPLGLLLGCLDQ